MAYSAIAGNIAFADEKKPFIASVQARAAFEKYLEYDESNHHFKVFVLGRSGGYAWAARSSYENAFKWADNGCAQSVSDFSCKLYAIGDTMVVNMKKADVEEVISMSLCFLVLAAWFSDCLRSGQLSWHTRRTLKNLEQSIEKKGKTFKTFNSLKFEYP